MSDAFHPEPEPLDDTQAECAPKTEQPEFGPEDFYYEGQYLVFTAQYHLKRGYCCNSGCRHCPYR